MRHVHVLVLLLSTLLISTLIYAQNEEVSVTNVNVWIRAVDASGNPVTGLQKQDFELYEDGKKMDPTCFEEVRFQIPSGEDTVEPDQASTTTPKRFVLFLDLYNTTQVELDLVRPELDRFLRRIHLKNWEIMMVAYLPTGKLGVVSPFTNSISSIRKLLDQARANPKRDQKIAQNEKSIMEIFAPVQLKNLDAERQNQVEVNNATASGGNTRALEEQYFKIAVSQAYRQAQHFSSQDRQSSEHALAALESFGQYYSEKLSGRQHTVILLVSGGVNVDPGRRYFDLVNAFVNRTAFGVDPGSFNLSVAGGVKPNAFDIEREVNHSIGKLNRHNLTLYAINTRGLARFESDITKAEAEYAAVDPQLIKDYQDSLAQMAAETGGLSFQDSQNFQIGFDRVLDDISHQYLVCYRAPDHKEKDDYHSIKVALKKPGIKLRHRQGYTE